MIDSVFWKKKFKKWEKMEKKILQNQSYNPTVNFPEVQDENFNYKQALKANCQTETNDYS